MIQYYKYTPNKEKVQSINYYPNFEDVFRFNDLFGYPEDGTSAYDMDEDYEDSDIIYDFPAATSLSYPTTTAESSLTSTNNPSSYFQRDPVISYNKQESISKPLTTNQDIDYNYWYNLIISQSENPNYPVIAYNKQSSSENNLQNWFESNRPSLVLNNQSTTSSSVGQSQTSYKSFADSFIKNTETYIGLPYKWGGHGKKYGGVDCSGLVYASLIDIGYKQLANELTANAATQWSKLKAKGFTFLDASSLLPGDLVYFKGTLSRLKNSNSASHVGIYIGNGMMIHAPKKGDRVKKSSINTNYWKSHLLGYARLYI